MDNPTTGTSLSVRVGISVLLAVIINALLFYLIHYLVSRTPTALTHLEDIHAVDFIRVKPERETPQQTLEEVNTPPPKQLQQPPQTTQYQPQSVNKPKPPQLDLPAMSLRLPSGLTGGPYLGDFRADSSEAQFTTLDAGKPVLQFPPVYPPRARRRGIEGRVLVEFTISETGAVEDPEILEAEPPRIFDRAVLRAIRRWKFNPRMIDGSFTRQRARKEIVFKLNKR